ncbi:thioesterase family protein [Rhodocista pekingensis]|uniref:Thioesterase family protein n=1 Tax=Rhodocista pekingensis TaxID=201185 RepID=A0ABW2KW87_9PROT
MNLLFRMLRVVVAALLGRPLHPLAASVVTLRVWPTDLDPNLHMTNSRYLAMMDIGRLDLIVRTRIWRVLLKRRWAPVLGSSTIRYRRSLAPFQRFRVRTQVICWDEKWLYIEHVFEDLAGEVHAVAMTKGLFLAGGRTVPTAAVLDALGGGHIDSPPVPPGILAWQQAEQEMSTRAHAT